MSSGWIADDRAANDRAGLDDGAPLDGSRPAAAAASGAGNTSSNQERSSAHIHLRRATASRLPIVAAVLVAALAILAAATGSALWGRQVAAAAGHLAQAASRRLLVSSKPWPWLQDVLDDGNGRAGRQVSPQEPVLGVPVLWMAPFLSGGGYGSEALSFATALADAGTVPELAIAQHGDAASADFWRGLPAADRVTLAALFAAAEHLDPAAAVVVCHSEPGAWAPPLFQTPPCPPPGGALFAVGRTMFETDRVAPVHVDRCNAMDEVWVPTDFHLATFAASGVDAAKLRKVPQAVDVAFFDPAAATLRSLPPRTRVFGNGNPAEEPPRFVFLSVFKWEARKGWDLLVPAFLAEFTAAEGVALVLLTSAYHSEHDFGRQLHELAERRSLTEPASGWPAVDVINGHVSQAALPALYKAADAFVLPSRGEGWGRPIVEAMAMSLPVIATNWSGMTEYLTASNSYPLAMDGLEVVPNGPFAGHLWARPSAAALRAAMREVVENRAEGRRRGQQARRAMVAKYSPAIVAGELLRQLQRLEATLRERGRLRTMSSQDADKA